MSVRIGHTLFNRNKVANGENSKIIDKKVYDHVFVCYLPSLVLKKIVGYKYESYADKVF